MTDQTEKWASPEEWQHLLSSDDCPFCHFVRNEVEVDDYGYTVARLERSILRLQRNQAIRGYCILIARNHVIEPFQMHEAERRLFFEDMTRAAQAMQQVFSPDKMNYEILGNRLPHLHVHLKPRYLDDAAPHRRINSRSADPHLLADAEYRQLVGNLREALGYIRERVSDPLLVNILDNQGRVTRWPTLKDQDEQMAVRRYLASKFEPGRTYTEREVNALLNEWHTFEDWALLRRELFMHEFIGRMKDGTAYWLKDQPTTTPSE